MDALTAPRGVVFDLDGTLVDNMPIHAEAFSIFSTRHGLPPLTLEDRARLDGKRNRDIFPARLGLSNRKQGRKGASGGCHDPQLFGGLPSSRGR